MRSCYKVHGEGALRHLVPIYSIYYSCAYFLLPSQKFSYRAYLLGGLYAGGPLRLRKIWVGAFRKKLQQHTFIHNLDIQVIENSMLHNSHKRRHST